MSKLLRSVLFAGLMLAGPGSFAARAESPQVFSAAEIEFFETEVRPLLVEQCLECHSAGAKNLMGGLRLDSRAFSLKGGDSGPAVVPGKPEESLLIEAIRWESFEMPPRGKLSEKQIATLTRWVEMGAPWPADRQTAPETAAASGYDWDRWRSEHWAFRPVRKPAVPEVHDREWASGDLDRFILARLEQAGLTPAVPAEDRVLVRRLYFDLIGLPPTPRQVERFLTAAQRNRPAAISDLIDELLDSPHYGERWARYWLDVARYTDGYGGYQDAAVYDQAWRYRDWVVESFNADRPLDEFLQMQIAGDLIGSPRDAVATGLFALGPTYRSDGGDPDSLAQAKAETLSDRLDTLSRGVLGLTLACARCHDHKFDPIPQQDYYSLAGVFNNSARHELPLVSADIVKAYDRQQQSIKDREKQINDLRSTIRREKRKATSQEEAQIAEWSARLDELKQTAPPKYDFAHAIHDTGAADMHVAIRGNLRKPREKAPRRFLKILAGDDAPLFTDGSGRRQLAEAITDPRNPLTYRVFVNRIWMHHFGEGLVRTPGNFGTLGEEPTHPLLLDWLTATFIESGLSIKQLHRTILLSSTWQMSGDFDETAFGVDGDNRLLWRKSPRRLDAEAWRDAVLTATGELDPSPGGPPTDKVDSTRRTLYFKVSRNGTTFETDSFLRLFDFPLMRATVPQRDTSIVPQQFLFLLNSDFMKGRAAALVSRLHEEGDTPTRRIRLAYRILYQRPPSADEVDLGLAFLSDTETPPGGPTAWEQYAQVLLSSNEFMYVR